MWIEVAIGHDDREDSDSGCLITYGIDVEKHANQIEVHNSEDLRDHILRLLQACPFEGELDGKTGKWRGLEDKEDKKQCLDQLEEEVQ